MSLNEWKTLIEMAQGLVTILGITVAGAWSYLTFLRGRSFAPNVQIRFALKQVIDWDSGKGAVVSVKIKNIGQTRVKKKNCLLTPIPIVKTRAKNHLALAGLERLDPSLDEVMQQLPRQYEIFNEHTVLEPGVEATEDILLNLDEFSACKVIVMFFEAQSPLMFFRHRQQWSSNAILDTSSVKKETNDEKS